MSMQKFSFLSQLVWTCPPSPIYRSLTSDYPLLKVLKSRPFQMSTPYFQMKLQAQPSVSYNKYKDVFEKLRPRAYR